MTFVYTRSNFSVLLKKCIPIFVIFAVLAAKNSAQADMIITIDSKTFQAETRDYFDVYIESSIDQNLLLASYKLSITPQIGNTASLFFRNTYNPLDPANVDNQSISEQSSSNYLFFGNTADTNFSANRQPNPLELIGSDSEATGITGVTMLANQKYLLTRVEVFTENPGTGTFTINLVNDPTQTFFLDSNFDEVGIDNSSFSGSNFSISSVPEPSSILFGLGGVFAIGFQRWRAARRIRSRTESESLANNQMNPDIVK
jgi:hypothetical protein